MADRTLQFCPAANPCDNVSMPKRIFAVLILALASLFTGAGTFAQQTPAPKPPAANTTSRPAPKPSTTSAKPLRLTTNREKESYALGMNIARGMKAQSIDVDPAIMARAIRDVLSGAKPLLTEDEAMAVLKQLQTEVRAKQEAQLKELGEKNLKEGQAFLAANRDKPGVVTLPDGLEYKVLTQGNGPTPRANDKVVCQYRGTLLDGTEFDSSAKHGGNATLPVGGNMIRGWTQVLEMMPVGSKWQIFIPPDLAYGERGAGQVIGPNATIIFDVQLIAIQPPSAEPAQPSSPNPNRVPPNTPPPSR
jgi:FKBP-type peptidyl-prolyl cis-trans isomerase FklB